MPLPIALVPALCLPLAASAATSYKEEVLADNPVSYWRLGESSGTTVTDQKGLNTGTYVGAVTRGAPGAILGDADTAVTLNGTVSQYMLFSAFKSHPTTAASVEFWLKSTDKSLAGSPYNYLTSASSNTNDLLVYNYQNLEVYVNGGNVGSGISATDGNWHHIVATWRSSDGKTLLYKDGVKVYESTLSTGATIAGNGVLMLGQEQDCAGGCLDGSQSVLGSMDEVALYNTVLSPERVLAHYAMGRQDTDSDGVPDGRDNCPQNGNTNQADNDADGKGDICDTDDDNDGVLDTGDNCPVNANPGQDDNDDDGAGDTCDPDDDGDGVADTADNCDFDPNADQADNDKDGEGDVCDNDDDNDGVADASDNCPFNANAGQADNDKDGPGDACDTDDDNDGVADSGDNCPIDPNANQANNDQDSQGDVCDPDDDNDSIADSADNCPLTANTDQANLDKDSLGDACDTDKDGDGAIAGQDCNDLDGTVTGTITYYQDADGDGFGDPAVSSTLCQSTPPIGYVTNGSDNCPGTANPDQADLDEDGTGDACDSDDDGDGAADGSDNCPLVSNPGQVDTDGNGTGDACEQDADHDGWSDGLDNCPSTSNSGQADLDSDGTGDACDPDVDGDGAATADDCNDRDATVIVVTTYYGDADDDGYGDPDDARNECLAEAPEGYVVDATDNCPDVSNVDQADADGDGDGDACDADDDGDGRDDAADNCPLVSNPGQTDTDGDGTGDACEDDADGDGVPDTTDNCPLELNDDQADLDGDGAGDVCDTDADGDGATADADCDDLDATVSGLLNVYPDDDGDGVGVAEGATSICEATAPEGYATAVGDNCPLDANPGQEDTDGDGVGDACDDEPTPEPTATPEPTDTPEPTETPEATDTPEPGSPTPEPESPTPEPESPTPEPESPTPEATPTPGDDVVTPTPTPGDDSSPTPGDDGSGCSCAQTPDDTDRRPLPAGHVLLAAAALLLLSRRSRPTAHDTIRTRPMKQLNRLPRILGLLALGALLTAAAPPARPVSIDVKEADIHNVLRLFSKSGGVNIVVADQVTGKVTLRVSSVPWQDAFDALLLSRGLGAEKLGNILYVDTLANLTARAEAKTALRDANTLAAPLKTVIIPLNNALADELKPLVQSFLTARGSVIVDTRTNSLIITDVDTGIDKARALLLD